MNFKLPAHLESLQAYALLNGCCEASLINQCRLFEKNEAHKLWLQAPYQDWSEVMPHLVALSAQQPFVHWVEQEEIADWGFIVYAPDVAPLVQHFSSLTKVYVPSRQAVFFRFFDPDMMHLILQHAEPHFRSMLMGPAHAFQFGNELIENPNPQTIDNSQQSPWLSIPAPLMSQIQGDEYSMLAANTEQWLQEQHASLYFAHPKPALTQLVARIVRQCAPNTQLIQSQLMARLRRIAQ